jgi:hypothetical protein
MIETAVVFGVKEKTVFSNHTTGVKSLKMALEKELV